ncbi:MAG: hypothetical protein HOO67_06220 [Candidatus Peribacteraceae bacterium]|nr:hypothetical protein [Candidatus Peribacteraceae bacterium]
MFAGRFFPGRYFPPRYFPQVGADPPVVIVQESGIEYLVELRDNNFNLVGRLEDEIESLQWGYSRIGGCDALRMVLNRKIEDFGNLSVDYDVQIKLRNPATNDYDLWWRGFLEQREPIFGEKERVSVDGFGYIAQLQRINVNQTYTTTEVSAIVDDILTNLIVPNTKIVRNAAKIATTGVTLDSIQFKDVPADQAIKTLAETVGTREWGVDRTREFFFQARSSTILKRYIAGKDVEEFRVLDSFGTIINRVIIEGGDVAGVKFRRVVSDAASITKYGLRERVVVNNAITTNAVADAYGAAILRESAALARRASASIYKVESLIESSTPLGTIILRGILGGTTWGTKKWGTFLWGGEFSYQPNNIRYSLNRGGRLDVRIELGQRRPELVEVIREMGLRLEEVRARA